ncbi:MAG: hypothetical protein LBV75_02680 [Paludibacter sp.]|nr:hypothetical protein [Paludibacter sp.]
MNSLRENITARAGNSNVRNGEKYGAGWIEETWHAASLRMLAAYQSHT